MKEYIREKIRILKQFNVKLTDEQLRHIRSLKTEIEVDNFAHDLLKPSYDCSGSNNKAKRNYKID